MQITIRDIMTQTVISVTPDQTLLDAHAITREKGIRHLPVLNAENKLIAIATQKTLIAKVMNLLARYGSDELKNHESKVNIMDVALSDFDTVKENDDVAQTARFFLNNKHGCLPVLDEKDNLVGIVTSSDFVKLAVHLLENP